MGKVHASIAAKVVREAAIITGSLFIHSIPAVFFFYSSSTHTYISRSLVDRIGVPIDNLGYDWVVSTPAGVVLTTDVCVRGVLS